MRTLVLGLLASASLAMSAQAASIVNGGFESGTVNPGGGFATVAAGPSLTNITGWTVGGHSVDIIGGYWQPQEGSRSIDLAGSGIGSLSQAIATIVGQAYRVDFWVARNPDGGITPRTGFVDVGGGSTAITYSNAGSSRPSNMLWEARSYDFTATNGTTNLRFSADPATSGSFFGLALDNVSITAVPEPTSWALMIAGFGLVGSAMRRRKPSVSVSYA
jgi:choice-of-anchor C domain-containing protein